MARAGQDGGQSHGNGRDEQPSFDEFEQDVVDDERAAVAAKVAPHVPGERGDGELLVHGSRHTRTSRFGRVKSTTGPAATPYWRSCGQVRGETGPDRRTRRAARTYRSLCIHSSTSSGPPRSWWRYWTRHSDRQTQRRRSCR